MPFRQEGLQLKLCVNFSKQNSSKALKRVKGWTIFEFRSVDPVSVYFESKFVSENEFVLLRDEFVSGRSLTESIHGKAPKKESKAADKAKPGPTPTAAASKYYNWERDEYTDTTYYDLEEDMKKLRLSQPSPYSSWPDRFLTKWLFFITILKLVKNF